jgi:hypothetical protein
MVRMKNATQASLGFLLRKFLLCFALASLPIHVTAKPEVLPPECSKSFGDRLVGWRLADSPPDAAEWAKSQRFNPAVAAGDFNGDRTRDWAGMVTIGEKTVVAACLSKGKAKEVVLIENPCGDMVYSAPAGSRTPNLDTGRTEMLRRDTIMTSCFGKAGKAHVYERGAFRHFLNAD